MMQMVDCAGRGVHPSLWEEPLAQVFAQAVLPKTNPRAPFPGMENGKGLLLLSRVCGQRPFLEGIPDWIRQRAAQRNPDLETAAERVRHDYRRFHPLRNHIR